MRRALGAAFAGGQFGQSEFDQRARTAQCVSMRVELGSLLLEELALELPASAGRPAVRRVRIQHAEGMRGTFETLEQGFRISDLAGQRLRLASLAWSFGKVVLASDQAVELGGLSGSLGRGGHEVEIKAATLTAPHVSLRIDGVVLAGQLQARDLTLQVSQGVGILRFGSALFKGLEIDLASHHLSSPELTVSELVVDWGGPAFRLEVRTAEASELSLQRGEQHLEARGVELTALASQGRSLSVGQARMAALHFEAPLPRPQQEAPAVGTESTGLLGRLFDRALLDGLSGYLRADVDVDLAVPILGRRHATHRPRLTITQGAIDYMQLENGLATLEDALIDFSVREGALVLERGLPLIPTRGRGKPILIWDLEPEDIALAQQRRIRLARLPNFRVAGKNEDDATDGSASERGGSAFRLRQLSLLDLDASLSAPENRAVAEGAVRELTFSELTVQGEVHYASGRAALPGRLEINVDTLRAMLRGVPAGARMLEGRLEIGAVRELAISFEGLGPRRIKGEAEGIAFAQLRLG